MITTFYVWKDNQEAFSKIEKKQELINKLLQVYFKIHAETMGDENGTFINGTYRDLPSIAAQKQILRQEFELRPPDPELGYPCCQLKKPCKHWRWDDIDSVWENELTGQTREVI